MWHCGMWLVAMVEMGQWFSHPGGPALSAPGNSAVKQDKFKAMKGAHTAAQTLFKKQHQQ